MQCKCNFLQQGVSQHWPPPTFFNFPKHDTLAKNISPKLDIPGKKHPCQKLWQKKFKKLPYREIFLLKNGHIGCIDLWNDGGLQNLCQKKTGKSNFLMIFVDIQALLTMFPWESGVHVALLQNSAGHTLRDTKLCGSQIEGFKTQRGKD